MDIVVFSLSWISIIAICIIIALLFVAYLRKWMMTYAIILTNFVVFIISLAFRSEIIGELAFRPIYLSFELFPQIYTLFTSMFLHSTTDFLHIIFNVFMFLLIAPSFENKIGRNKILIIYLITGACAGLFHSIIGPMLPHPYTSNPLIGLIGASGAISGIIGAYTFSFPKDRVFFPIGYFITRVPMLWAGIAFMGFQTVYFFIQQDPGVAYLAHIGGFLSGFVIAPVLIRRKKSEDANSSQVIYYDAFGPQRLKNINLSVLRKLATNSELEADLKRIENENVPQVREVWIEHFLEKARCPKCGDKLKNFDRDIWCENCDFKTKY